jgi:hypothetical protein
MPQVCCSPARSRSALAALALLGASASAVVAGDLPFAFRPGHVYAATDSGLREYTADLQFVASRQVPGLSSATGCIFSPSGNLVMIGYLGGAGRLLEINAAGTVVRQRSLGGGLLRGSYLEMDGQGRLLVANESSVSMFSTSFAPLGSLPFVFERASGVTVAPTGEIYATDQSEHLLVRFGADGAFLGSSVTGFVPTGLDVGPDGQLYQTLYGSRTVERVNPLTGQRTALYSTSPQEPTDIEFLPDGTYYLSVYANRIEHRSASHAILHSVVVGEFYDSVAVYVPAPGVAGVVLLVGAAAMRRRR